jgi:hypothetical protein
MELAVIAYRMLIMRVARIINYFLIATALPR